MTNDSERPVPDVSYEFDHDPGAPRAARDALDPLLADADDDHDGTFAESVKLAASEMVSNVVQHTADGGRLDAWDDDPLLIEVSDHEPNPPRPVVEPVDISGRGLMIINHAADDWGIEKTAGGKVVWAQFRRPGSPSPRTEQVDEPHESASEPPDEPG